MSGQNPTKDGAQLTHDQLQAVQMLVSGTTLRQIAHTVNVSERTVQRWAKLPAFKVLLKDLRQQARTKTVEKLEKELSVTLEEIAEEHLRCHRMAREMAEKALEILSSKEVEDVSPRTLAAWSQMLARHIEGERQASSLQYLDINRAITIVCQAGYEVRDPGLNTPQADDEDNP